MDIFVCGCCSNKFPTIHKNAHHKTPRALGGKDTKDNLIELCPSCHDALHAIAYKMLSKKTSQTQIVDSLALIFSGNVNAQNICMDLALKVRNAQIHAKEEGLSQNHLIQLSLTLRKYFKPLIMNRYRELKLTQESYIRMLILNDLTKRFNLTGISLAEENRLINYIKKEKANPLIERND